MEVHKGSSEVGCIDLCEEGHSCCISFQQKSTKVAQSQAKVEKLQPLQRKVHEETEANDLTKKHLTGKQQHLYRNRLEKRFSEILIHCHSHAPQTPQQPEGTLQEKDILPTFLEIKTALTNDEPQEPAVGRSIVEQQESSASLELTFLEGPVGLPFFLS